MPSEDVSEAFDPDDFEIPDGHLGVASLGALTAEPGTPFSWYAGPGSRNPVASDVHAYSYAVNDAWIAYVAVGKLSSGAVDYDPEDIEQSAEDVVDARINGGAFSSVEGMESSLVSTNKLVIGGRTGALTSSVVTWETSGSSDDSYEVVYLLLVDVEGEAWVGLASIPESADEYADAATLALVDTTFAY